MNFLTFNPPIEPEKVIRIEDMVANGDSLFTTFSFLKDEQFILPTYLLNEDIEFRVLHDRNFTSELIGIFNAAIKSPDEKLTKDQRIIAAYQAFFQMANITSEPNLSFYEYSDKNDYDRVSSELNLFRVVDNFHVKHWANLALGEPISYSKDELKPIHGSTFSEDESKKKLDYFEANYLIVKKTAVLKKSGLSNIEIMKSLLRWLHQEYLFTGPAVLFMNFYLCPNKPGLKKMIKNHERDGIRNATWDLCFLQEYMKKIKNEINGNKTQRWLACSNDNAIKRIIPLLFANHEESKDEFEERLKEAFIVSWGKNTKNGKDIYNLHRDYFAKAESLSRKVNQENFRQHVEKMTKNINVELNIAE